MTTGDDAAVRRDEPVSPPSPGEPWTVLRMIRWSGRYLREKGVEEGRLDAEHLLAESLGLDRLELYLQFDRPLTAEELERFKPLLLRRADREPLQHVLGHTAFRELDLKVDARALIPRSETEELVGAVLDWAADQKGGGRVPGGTADEGGAGLRALDVGTGTGAIALSLALEGPFERVVATDSSDDALALADMNRERAGLETVVELRSGSLFEPLGAAERFDVVVSNPPYIGRGDRESLAPEVAEWEPPSALYAGPEGLDVLRPLIRGAPGALHPGGLLALEIGAGQAEAVSEMVRETDAFEEPTVRRDLAGRDRILTAVRR